MPSSASRTPILNKNLITHQKPTGSPQTLPLTAQLRQYQNAHNDISALPPHTQHNDVGGATPPPHNHQPFTSRQAIFQPDTAQDCTCVLKLINQRARVRNVAKVRCHLRQGHTHPLHAPRRWGPRTKHRFRKPCQSHA